MVSVDVKHHVDFYLLYCVNREVGLGFHSLSHSSPVPNMPSFMVSVDVRLSFTHPVIVLIRWMFKLLF